MSGCFDANRLLRMIALQIKSPSPGQAADVRGALIAKYGRPTIVRSANSLEWNGLPGGDDVVFHDTGNLGVEVLYKPGSGKRALMSGPGDGFPAQIGPCVSSASSVS